MKFHLERYLTKLQRPFDITWIGNFKALIKLLFSKQDSKEIIDIILREKGHDHESFLKTMKKFSEALHCYFDCIDNEQKVASHIENLCLQLSNLGAVDVHSQQFKNPCIRAEDLFFEVSANLFPFIQQLLQRQALVGVVDSQIIEENYGVYKAVLVLPFSADLKMCELEAEKLRGVREVSNWGKWDKVLELYEWVKDGFSNEAFGENMKNVFYHYKYNELVQDIGHYFVEQLDPSVAQPSAKALELYLDGLNHYWILVHRGEDEFPETCHIKRLYEGKALNLLKKLLNSPENTLIECEEKLTKILGELHIKGETAKVFFPETAIFAGAFVELRSLGVSIDQDAILNSLHQLQANKKHRPSFNKKEYYQRSWLYNKPR